MIICKVVTTLSLSFRGMLASGRKSMTITFGLMIKDNYSSLYRHYFLNQAKPFFFLMYAL